MKKLFTVVFIVYANFSFSQADTAQQLTLQQCIAIALKNNADVQTQDIIARSANVTWQQARAGMLPTLNGDITHGLNQGRSIDPFTNSYVTQNINFANYSLSSGVVLSNAFSIQNNIKASRLAFSAGEMEVQQTKDAVALNVILNYLLVLTNEDIYTQAQNQKALSAKQVERLGVLNDEGTISPNELYDVKGKYAQDELYAVNAKNDLENAKLTLAQLLNIPYSGFALQRLSLSEMSGAEHNNTDSVYRAALQNLAIVKATGLRKQSADYYLRAYRSSQFPTLFLSGGLYTNYSSIAVTQELVSSQDVATDNYVLYGSEKLPLYVRQDNYASHKIGYAKQFTNNLNTSVSLGLRIPLLNNYQTRAQIKIAALQLQQAQLNDKTTRVQLQQNVEKAALNKTSARARYNVLDSQVIAFRESARVAEARFEAGAINSVDYLTARNNADNASINLIIARYDYVLRSMILDYYSGKLSFDQ